MNMRLLDRLFGRAEEINGAGRCPTYLWRWTVLRTPWGKVYVHKFTGSDWSRDLHDHPKRFISFGLWGSYLEETKVGFKRYRAPWIRTFPAEHAHRLSTPWGPCWTLVVALRTVREWGFWHHSAWIQWERYVKGSESHIADRMTACK